jgi:hypothetical protein
VLVSELAERTVYRVYRVIWNMVVYMTFFFMGAIYDYIKFPVRHNINHYRVRPNFWSPLVFGTSTGFFHMKTLPWPSNPKPSDRARNIVIYMLLSAFGLHKLNLPLYFYNTINYMQGDSYFCSNDSVTCSRQQHFDSSVWIWFVLTKDLHYHFSATNVSCYIIPGTSCYSHRPDCKAVDRAALIQQKSKVT